MIAVALRIRVSHSDATPERYRRRQHRSAAPCRPDVEMLLHLEQPAEFAVIHWLDTKANEAYRRHPALRTAHPRVRGLPDLRIGPEGRAIDWYEVLS
jgi:hypothetical protein